MPGRQSENIFERTIEEPVDRPESALSLGVMKMIDDILRINEDVVVGVVDAFVHQIDHRSWGHCCAT